MRHRSLLVAAGLCATLILAATAEAAFPGRNGQVAFERKVGRGKTALWRVLPRTRRARRITRVPRRCSRGERWRDTDPAHSPSGRRIVFVHRDNCGRRARSELRLVRANRSRSRRLRRVPRVDVYASFSPSGREILYAYGDSTDDSLRVRVIDARSGRLKRRLRTRPADTWSPSSDFVWGSTNLLAVTDQGPIYVARSDLTEPRQVTNPQLYPSEPGLEDVIDFAPEWDPSGLQVAFVRNLCFGDDMRCDRYRPDIWVTGIAPGAPERRLTWSGRVGELAFSPDGEEIAFEEGRAIETKPVAGGPSRTLVRRGRGPSWQPLP